ncbi:MAG: 1-deoxy-D-xylulose-5-phosphate reductoisomerase, partial [Muribaculaceae bacterium]|nr:1-deoxy-D-xylulose-5-phosphate reductoisomerase [Muribaculaceae bacterium]
LFGCTPDDIDIVVHPQSIVIAMVQFADGGVKAQLGLPDMHLPISYALSYPDRLPGAEKPMCLADYSTLTFEHPDMQKFPLLAFAFEALKKGGVMPCALNAANERAVAAFLAGRIRFTDMPLVARHVMDQTPTVYTPGLSDFVETNTDAVARADAFIATLSR